jgi:sigma-54 dependent transcriptional regulator, acetoin dehydrogenase operon transcriptional activator AcoR
MVKLLDIKSLVQKIADAISSVLNMDVIISDNEFNKIADTKKHFNLEVEYIKDNYILGRVIQSGKARVIEGIEFDENCRVCKEKDECNLKAMICIPIIHENHTLGAIGLIAISEEYREILLQKQNNLIEFLNRMSELIVSKVLEQEASNKLEIIKNHMVSIINSIDDGVMTIDEEGCILHSNHVISEAFGIRSKNLFGKLIYEVIPYPYIEKLVQKNELFENIEASINYNNKDFHALISGKPVSLGKTSAGSILIFKKMADVYNVVNKISLNNLSITFDGIVGRSLEIEKAKTEAKMVANSNSTVLILGESGTGKELFARAMHFSSSRSEKPFIALNCAAIPESLLESELFGYEEGAFTGAVKGGRIGKFQLAQGGTIFLDEIGDLPIHLQTKLLRVLQEKSIEKIGGQKTIPLDVRVIAATNAQLDVMVEEGEFRKDLYYRLSVIPINIPPLRKREGDVKILLDYFLGQYNIKLNKSIKGFSKSAETLLMNYEWQGNVRELENVVEYAVNMETESYITINHVPQRIIKLINKTAEKSNVTTLEDMEKKLIAEAIEIFGNSFNGKNMAAEALGIGTATLYRKLKKYEIE